MSGIEQSLLNSLEELQQAASAKPEAKTKPDLLKIFARIDDLGSQLPPNTDGALIHYIRRRSYEKARLYLLEKQATEHQPQR